VPVIGTDEKTGWLKASVVRVVYYGTFSYGSGISICMAFGEVGCDGMMVPCGRDGACGDNESFSMMIVFYLGIIYDVNRSLDSVRWIWYEIQPWIRAVGSRF